MEIDFPIYLLIKMSLQIISQITHIQFTDQDKLEAKTVLLRLLT